MPSLRFSFGRMLMFLWMTGTRTKQDRTEADIWRDRVTAHGRAISRDADAFSLPRHVIDRGIETDDEDEPEDSNTNQPSAERRIWKESYRKYKLIYRNLEADIVNSGQKNYISKERIEEFVSQVPFYPHHGISPVD